MQPGTTCKSYRRSCSVLLVTNVCDEEAWRRGRGKERSFSYRSFCPIFTLEFSTFTSGVFISDLIMMQICILYHLTHLPPSSSRLFCHTVNPWPQITVQTSTSLINFEPIGNLHFSVLEWNHDSEGFKCHSHTKKNTCSEVQCSALRLQRHELRNNRLVDINSCTMRGSWGVCVSVERKCGATCWMKARSKTEYGRGCGFVRSPPVSMYCS